MTNQRSKHLFVGHGKCDTTINVVMYSSHIYKVQLETWTTPPLRTKIYAAYEQQLSLTMSFSKDVDLHLCASSWAANRLVADLAPSHKQPAFVPGLLEADGRMFNLRLLSPFLYTLLMDSLAISLYQTQSR